MKTNSILSKTLLVFCILGIHYLSAQTYPGTATTPVTIPADLNVGTVTNDTGGVTTAPDGVLFYNPATTGPSMDLGASLTDANGNTFSSYEWYTMTYSGTTETENVITGETTATLSRSSLSPGYHKYRVYGLGGAASCQSDDYQDMIVFVLPEVGVTSSYDDNGNTGLIYCSNDVPDEANAITLSTANANYTSDYTANTDGYPEPAPDDFDYTYEWFAIPATAPSTPVSISTTSSAAITLTTPGTYTFKVKVQYSVKSDASKSYTVFENVVQNGANDLEVVITEAPGNPTISIDSVTD